MPTKTKSADARPYVYRCVHKETGEYYYGYRCANKVKAEDDFGIKYKTSSRKVRQHFDEYDWEINSEFFDAISAYDHEQLKIYESWGDPLLINQHHNYGTRAFRTSGPKPHSQKTIDNMIKANATPEVKARRSAGLKGRKFSKAHLANLKVARNKRGPYSVETRQKISKSNKGRVHSQETKDKMSKAHTGKIVTQETRDKSSKAQTGLKRSDVTRQRIAAARTGTKLKPESIAKRTATKKANREKEDSDIANGKYTDEEVAIIRNSRRSPKAVDKRVATAKANREKIDDDIASGKYTDEEVAIIKNNRKRSPETIAKISATSKATWEKKRLAALNQK